MPDTAEFQPFYVIGDVHGQKTMLDDALARIEADGGTTARVIFLGDLTDRGPDSRGVVETVLQGMDAGRDWTVLKGNHDRMFARFLSHPMLVEPGLPVGLDWLHPRLGGRDTLASYGVAVTEKSCYGTLQLEAMDAVPVAHVDFLHTLPLSLQIGPYFLTHAGIRPGIPLDAQGEEDLIWIREPFLSDGRDHGAVIVHGHTALDEAAHYGNRVNLDSGAGYDRDLTAARFDADGVHVLEPRGRRRLRP